MLVEAAERGAADAQVCQQLPRAPRVLRQDAVRAAEHPHRAQRDVLQVPCAMKLRLERSASASIVIGSSLHF